MQNTEKHTDSNSEIQRIDSFPSVQLVLSSGGQIIGSWGAESLALAQLIELWAELPDVPVCRTSAGFVAAGQSCYQVGNSEFLAAIRGTLFFVPWSTWDTQSKFSTIVPESVVSTFVVSY